MTPSKIFSFLAPVFLIIELWIENYLFAKKYTKKSYFFFSFLGLLLTSIGIVISIEIAYSSITNTWFKYGDALEEFDLSYSIFNFFFYCFILLLSILSLFLCFKINFAQAVFLASCSYAGQHISRNLTWLIMLIDVFSTSDNASFISFFFEVFFFCVLSVFLYFFFIRKNQDNIYLNSENKRKGIMAFVVAIVCIGMSRVTIDVPGKTTISIFSSSVYAILSCLLILWNAFDITSHERMKNEVDMMSEMLRNERRQYEMSKENIEIINIKCHDLKHQISLLRDGNKEGLEEVEKALTIYDSSFKTGNDELDVLLTEKKLLCERHGIQLTCVANGKLLSFMDKLDVYSLFGNALSNAMESSEKIKDSNKRCINVIVRKVEKMLVIHVENYFIGQMDMKNGLPVTKNDERYHGFGMLSMTRIAHKYKGDLSVSIKGDMFLLDIILPMEKDF